MIRRYAVALIDLLRIELPDTKIPIGIASPRREFGTQSERQGHRVEARLDATIPLPSMVLSPLDWNLNRDRFIRAKHRKLRYSDDLNMVTQSRHPLPYDFNYQLDIWTKYRDDLNLILAYTMTKFENQFATLQIDLGHPWGVKKVFVRAEHVTDNTDSSLEPDNDREPRATVDLVLEGWLPLKPKDVRTVRKVIADVSIEWIEPGKGLDAQAFKRTLEEA